MTIAVRFRKMFDGCQEMALSHIRPDVERMFENIDVALLEFAETAESNQIQSMFFEAMSEIRAKRTDVENEFLDQIRLSFSHFPVEPQDLATGSKEGAAALSLIDSEDIETQVATQNATSKLSGRLIEQIHALKQRLTIVNGGTAITENHIPAGPAWLGAAFQRAIKKLDVNNKVRLVFIALFEKHVLSKCDTVFEEYNTRLVQADILPNLSYEVRKSANEDKRPSGQEQPEPAAASHLDDQSGYEVGDKLFSRICDLISGHTHQSANDTHTPGDIGTSSIGRKDGSPGAQLINEISALQSTIATDNDSFIENITIDDSLITKLQSTLAEERARLHVACDEPLPAADSNVIELVGMMFEYMLNDATLPNAAKALLSRLHTLMLKVAVVDKQFFTHHDHPARLLLNQLIVAGTHFVDDNELDRGLFPDMKDIVERALLEFHEDVTLFDTLRQDLDHIIQEHEARTNRVAQRANQAASGQDKLQAARNRAQSRIVELTGNRTLAKPVNDFLRHIWTDKFTFILLRDAGGEDSEAWKQAGHLAADAIDYSFPPGDDQNRDARHSALLTLQQRLRDASADSQQFDKDKILTALFTCQDEALLQSAEQLPEPEDIEPVQAPETVQPDQADLSDELVAIIKKLNHVPFGTWFEYQAPGREKKRAKLSWRSTITGKYMFVDHLGVKTDVIPIRDLADWLLNGAAHIVQTEKKPFVDRALEAIYRLLDRAA